LFELGVRASLPQRLRAAAAPIIRDLWDLTGERIGLWVHHDAEMVSITAVPGRLPMLSTRAGMRSPALTTASGKAFLAFCDDTEIVDRVSAPLIEDAAVRFRVELSQVRESAIAADDGVAYPGIVAFASPVQSAEGTVIGAISIAGLSGSLDQDRVGPLVRTAGRDLSRRLAAA
jgi:DNA-binding IclR family transcriptional regulator